MEYYLPFEIFINGAFFLIAQKQQWKKVFFALCNDLNGYWHISLSSKQLFAVYYVDPKFLRKTILFEWVHFLNRPVPLEK